MNQAHLPPNAAPAPAPGFTDAELERLETLLHDLGEPAQPMDLTALDGYLCGVLLQPRPVPFTAWWPPVLDVQGQRPFSHASLPELQALVQRRHAELDSAITQRQWFDPWVFAEEQEEERDEDGVDDDDDPDHDDPEFGNTRAMQLWVAGFAAAMEHFPQLMDRSDRDLVEPLAVLFLHFDPAELEDADALLAMIDTLEPPEDLDQAVQDSVRAVMMIADVIRPQARPPARAPLAKARPHRPRSTSAKTHPPRRPR